MTTTTATLATMTGTLSPPSSSSAAVVGERVFILKNVGEAVTTSVGEAVTTTSVGEAVGASVGETVGVVGARVPTIGDSVVGVNVGDFVGDFVGVFVSVDTGGSVGGGGVTPAMLFAYSWGLNSRITLCIFSAWPAV